MGEVDRPSRTSTSARPRRARERVVARDGFTTRPWAGASGRSGEPRRVDGGEDASRTPTNPRSVTGNRSPGRSPGAPAHRPARARARRTGFRRTARIGGGAPGAGGRSRAGAGGGAGPHRAERGELRRSSCRAEPSVEAEGTGTSPWSACHQQPDGPVPQPADNEPEHDGAWGASSHWTSSTATTSGRRPGQPPHGGERRERDGPRVGLLGALGKEKSDLQRAALRAGEILQDLRVGERGGRRARRGRSSSPPRWAGPRATRLPATRGTPRPPPATAQVLPTPASPAMSSARVPVGDALQEPLHALELVVSSDELGLHGLERPSPYSGRGRRSGGREVGEGLRRCALR